MDFQRQSRPFRFWATEHPRQRKLGHCGFGFELWSKTGLPEFNQPPLTKPEPVTRGCGVVIIYYFNLIQWEREEAMRPLNLARSHV